VLLALPSIKGTGLSLYPVAALVFLVALWRRHSRAEVPGWVALALSAVLVGELSSHLLGGVRPVSSGVGTAAIGSSAKCRERSASPHP